MSNELTTSLASSKANTSIARWYAVQVASSCEKKVKATLEQRSVTLGVNNRIIEIEIPQTPGIKLKKDGSRQTTEEKVFPGYVLVRMILDEDTMMAVKSTPNVINFVGAEDGIRDMEGSRGLGDVYKRQHPKLLISAQESLLLFFHSLMLLELHTILRCLYLLLKKQGL